MKKTITFLFFLASINVLAQNDTITKQDLIEELNPLKSNIEVLQKENNKLKSDINNLKIELNKKLQNTTLAIDSLQSLIQSNKDIIEQKAEELDLKIKDTDFSTNQKITDVDKSLNKNSLYGIIGLLLVILLSGLLYLLLRKRQKTDKTEVVEKLQQTKTELSQESTRLDLELLNVIEKQLKVVDKLNVTEAEIDHTFHKNSANELQRITNYANTLSADSQEAIALQGSLGRLRNYFNASDYEITDFTGNDYDERIPMKIRETIYEETLVKGSEIISKTLKPQIKFKGIVIQESEVITKYNN